MTVAEQNANDVQTPVEGESKTAAAQFSEGLKQRAAAQQQPKNEPKPPAQPDSTAGEPGGADESVTEGGELTPHEELKLLRDKVAKLELENESRDATRKAQDTTDDFIREHWNDAPRDLVRKFLPVTADKGLLLAESGKLMKLLREFVNGGAKSGRFNEIRGTAAEGGVPPARQPINHGSMPAGQLLAQGIGRKH